MTEILEPCPFAHHNDQLRLAQSNPYPYVSDEADGEFAVVCRVCTASTRRYYRRDMAVRAWNTRATRSAESAEKRGREMFAAELLNQLDKITSTTAAFHLVHSLCCIEVGREPTSLGVLLDEKSKS